MRVHDINGTKSNTVQPKPWNHINSLHLIPKHERRERERKYRESCELLKPQNFPFPVTHLLQSGHTFKSFPNSYTNNWVQLACLPPGWNNKRVRSGLRVPIRVRMGAGQGRAVQMAQMARFGFLTVGSCSGHQVTGAQLALPAAGEDSWERGFFWGPAGSTKGLKKYCAVMDIPYHGLACTSFLYPACPPWWRVLTCPALRAAACRTATSSADGSHMSLDCQCPHVGPMPTVLPCCPEVFQVLVNFLFTAGLVRH